MFYFICKKRYVQNNFNEFESLYQEKKTTLENWLNIKHYIIINKYFVIRTARSQIENCELNNVSESEKRRTKSTTTSNATLNQNQRKEAKEENETHTTESV